jgi:ferritin heavy chain
MKAFYGIVLILGLVDLSMQSQSWCEVQVNKVKDAEKWKWQDMDANCMTAISDQIHRELTASLTYLAIGAHFTGDKNFRPNVAAFFLESANEERAHAKDLINYLTVRGQKIEKSIIPDITPSLEWSSIEDALTKALKIETDVRSNFVDIIEVCEGREAKDKNDYHAADLMTGKFLEEQHESIRKIVGHLSTLTKMKHSEGYGDFAEIIFDKNFA